MSRIVIAEDETIVARDLFNRLNDLGHDICGVYDNAAKLISEIQQKKPDLILLDIILKGNMDGIDAIQEIKGRYPVPFVYITASTDESTLHRATLTQPYGYIMKPFEDRELKTAIEMALYRFSTEQILENNRRWQTAILNNIHDSVIALDEAGKIILMNRAAGILTGWDTSEIGTVSPSRILDLTRPESHTKLKIKDIAELGKGKPSNPVRLILTSKEGKHYPIETTFSMLEESRGIHGTLISFRDLSHVEQAREELHKLNSVVEQNPNSILILDSERKVHYANPAFFKRSGLADPSIQNKEILTPGLLGLGQNEIARIWELVESGHTWQGVCRSTYSADVQLWEAITIAPILSAEGRTRGYFMILEDISERKHAEDALQKTLLELADLNRTLDQRVKMEVDKNREKDQMMLQQSRLAAMGEMIGNIAHQWRQPLNSLGILVQNIQGAYEYNRLNNDYMTQAVEKTLDIIQHMSQTIDDFRNFFKPEKEKEPFDIAEAVIKTLGFIDATLRDHSILVITRLEKSGSILGYFNEYCQVVLNILNNAKDVLIDRKIENPCIIIEAQITARHAELHIIDNAGGIDKSILNKIFDPYFTTKENGTGIGLYMSKMIIEKNMGGSISARNTKEGAEFIIKCGNAVSDKE